LLRKIAPDGDGRWNDNDYREKHDQDDHIPVDVAEALSERGASLDVVVISIVVIANHRESLRLASGGIVKRELRRSSAGHASEAH
jgi:hypothetical protein